MATTSLTVQPMNIIHVTDARIKVDNERSYIVTRGPLSVDVYEQPQSGNVSTSQISFSFTNPNLGTAIDRKLYIRVGFTVTLRGTSTTVPPRLLSGLGHDFACRDFPISRNTKTCQLKINNTSVSTQVQDIFDAFRWYHMKDHKNTHSMTTTPNYPDQDQTYSQLVNTPRNPLGSYDLSSCGDVEHRGGYNNLFVVSDDGTTAVVNVEFVEPVFVSPLAWGYGDHSALYHVQNMDLTLIFDSNLSNNLFSAVSGLGYTNFTSITSTIWKQPTLLVTQLKIPELMQVPQYIEYPYYDIFTAVQNTNITLAPGQSQVININSIQIQTIPKRMYILAKRNENSKSIYTTDTFARITALTVQLGTVPCLTGSSPEQLYQISQRNGCDMSYQQWYGSYGQGLPATRTYSGVGSIFCAEFGSDIGLPSDVEAVGILKNDQLRITLTIQNIHPTESINFWTYVTLINEGVFTLQSNLRSIVQTGVITKSDVLASRNAPEISGQLVEQIEGGSFFGKIRNIIRNAPGMVRKILPYIEKALPYVERGIDMLGVGEGEGVCESCQGQGVVGGCGCCGSGARVGGRMVSRKSLLKFK